jgi:hypothetical protein
VECYTAYVNRELEKKLKRKDYTTKVDVRCCGNPHGARRNQCKEKVQLRLCTCKGRTCNCRARYINEELLYKIETLAMGKHVECPKCKMLVERDVDNECFCHECSTEFCQKCLVVPYHSELSCTQYQYLQRQEDPEVLEMVKKGEIRFCPGCGNGTTKSTGCNKMYCTECLSKWCWLCGEKIMDYSHFRMEGGNKCAGRLFEGVDVDAYVYEGEDEGVEIN